MASTRLPAVAGAFYPSDARALRQAVSDFLASVEGTGTVPKAIIVPHAGYVYSGPIAATAYARIVPARDRITRVVLLGPAHRVWLEGLALPDADGFVSPLGVVPLDKDAMARVIDLPHVCVSKAAHAQEHSLEVHLPFLQVVLDSFTLVPFVVGKASPQAVGDVLEALWGGPETLIVVSSDLSHYLDYQSARAMDEATSKAIEALKPEHIRSEQACGRIPVGGLLHVARKKGLRAQTIDLRNSGDTAGPKGEVVGYGAYVFE